MRPFPLRPRAQFNPWGGIDFGRGGYRNQLAGHGRRNGRHAGYGYGLGQGCDEDCKEYQGNHYCGCLCRALRVQLEEEKASLTGSGCGCEACPNDMPTLVRNGYGGYRMGRNSGGGLDYITFLQLIASGRLNGGYYDGGRGNMGRSGRW